MNSSNPCSVIEARETHPATVAADIALSLFNEDEIREAWRRMLERKDRDPEGAITAARSLVESVCKHILEKEGQHYPDHADLPKLYRLTSESLNLAPDQHTEEAFKRILGGCSSIIDGLASVRNRLSDAHGKGRRPVKPAGRHAELVVNVAGSIAAFLISTWSAKAK